MERAQKMTKAFWEHVNVISSVVLAVSGIAALVFSGCQIADSRKAVDRQLKEARESLALQLNESRDSAKIQHLMEFVNKFDGGEFVTIRRNLAHTRMDRVHETLRPLNPDNIPEEMYEELDFCEDLGLLVRRGYLNTDDVNSDFGDWLVSLYADAHQFVEHEQKDDATYYNECSNLIQQIRKMQNNNGEYSLQNLSSGNIYDFYDSEARIREGLHTYRARK